MNEPDVSRGLVRGFLQNSIVRCEHPPRHQNNLLVALIETNLLLSCYKAQRRAMKKNIQNSISMI